MYFGFEQFVILGVGFSLQGMKLAPVAQHRSTSSNSRRRTIYVLQLYTEILWNLYDFINPALYSYCDVTCESFSARKTDLKNQTFEFVIFPHVMWCSFCTNGAYVSQISSRKASELLKAYLRLATLLSLARP